MCAGTPPMLLAQAQAGVLDPDDLALMQAAHVRVVPASSPGAGWSRARDSTTSTGWTAPSPLPRAMAWWWCWARRPRRRQRG
ncbi:hypothetical protein NB693_25705 [Pantoea ananatis]|uniref:hypothetical protein n=1 Tax=Pantoea ananas TaxID=553 RepID=UPI00221FD9BC|nr:hypothetical protein [Pantoea ananatis]